jgi:putative protein kinase ArgK-like GTPase of G3E family
MDRYIGVCVMTDREMKTASFRVSRELWDEFIAKAESEGLTGTRVIVDAIERYVAGSYPVIERQKRKPRSVSSRQFLTTLSRQLAEVVAQIDRLASGQSSLLADVQELKKK